MLIIAISIGVYALLTDLHGCGDEKPVFVDTSTHTVIIDRPVPDTVYIPRDSIIYVTVYKNPYEVSKLLRTRDSLLRLLSDNHDSTVFAWVDSVNRDVVDSVLQIREYGVKAGDSLVQIEGTATVLGYLNRMGVTWKHTIPEVRAPKPKWHVYTGLGASFQAKDVKGYESEVYVGKTNLFGVGVQNIGEDVYWKAKLILRFR